MKDQIEPCLCGERCFAAADVDGMWWAECRECCYRSPLVGDLASTIATHNRMMRAARGEAVSSTLVTVEHSRPLELAQRIQNRWAQIASQLKKETGK